ncbi:MAG: type II secretion system protein [Bdellovibrionota bacterium]
MNQKGFTLIEILMVVMLVAILAAVSIPQFIDFRVDAKNAATQSALGTLRTSIITQYSNMILHCNAIAGTYPTTAQVNANDVTTGAFPCTAAMITNVAERAFVAGAAIPDNPWSGSSPKNTVNGCVGAATGCAQNDNTDCAGAAYSATSAGWCYNPTNGQIWANSQLNQQATKENTF